MIKTSALAAALAAPLLALGSSPALAVLGGDATSISTDQARLKAAKREVAPAAAAAGYTIHELQLDSGTLVREYLGAEGKVFAVAWQGPFLPNLQQLFGTYYAPYTEAVKRQQGQRRPVMLQQSNLVVESAGRMRAFSGRAYDPSLLPANVRLEEIQ